MLGMAERPLASRRARSRTSDDQQQRAAVRDDPVVAHLPPGFAGGGELRAGVLHERLDQHAAFGAAAGWCSSHVPARTPRQNGALLPGWLFARCALFSAGLRRAGRRDAGSARRGAGAGCRPACAGGGCASSRAAGRTPRRAAQSAVSPRHRLVSLAARPILLAHAHVFVLRLRARLRICCSQLGLSPGFQPLRHVARCSVPWQACASVFFDRGVRASAVSRRMPKQRQRPRATDKRGS